MPENVHKYSNQSELENKLTVRRTVFRCSLSYSRLNPVSASVALTWKPVN